jgi:hypothetical protein
MEEISTVTSEATGKRPFSSPGAVTFSPLGDVTEAEHLEELLDEALTETFPASDAIAIAIERGHTEETIARTKINEITQTNGPPS